MRFVDSLDRGDGVEVLLLRELVAEGEEDVSRSFEVLRRRLPKNGTTSSRVVEPVLRSRYSVKINLARETVRTSVRTSEKQN